MVLALVCVEQFRGYTLRGRDVYPGLFLYQDF
jgi:hypothetical protein